MICSRYVRLFALVTATFVLSLSANSSDAADLKDLIDGKAEKAVGDCKFTEGPAWHPDGFLLFSDIPNNRIIRVNADGSSSDWMTESGGTNGIVCDAAGNVYVAQGDERRVSRLKAGKDGKGELVKVLADKFEGKTFNKPNDLALDADSGLYFTDPNYRPEPTTQPVEGVYYISKDGQVSRVVDSLKRPNGVLVTADGKGLLVANINDRQIMHYDIVGPGKLSEGKAIFTGDEQLDGGGPDGMAFDENGNIYATYKTVVVLSPKGELIGRVDVPEKPANCTFGGKDGKTLFITARTSLYQLPMQVSGAALRETGPQGDVLAANDAAAPTTPVKGDEELEETVEVKLGRPATLTLNVPKSWTKEEPKSRMRLGEFTIPAAEGDEDAGELAIFGALGGSVKANVDRWIGQFKGEGREVKVTKGKAGDAEYVFVEISGTFNKPDGPPFLMKTKPVDGYKMLGVIHTTKEHGNQFLKLTAPEKTADAAAAGYRHSFGGDAEKEEEYTLE